MCVFPSGRLPGQANVLPTEFGVLPGDGGAPLAVLRGTDGLLPRYRMRSARVPVRKRGMRERVATAIVVCWKDRRSEE